jgi:hypothetical protein
MLQSLKDLFNSLSAAPGSQSAAERDHALRLATAVLLVEVMRADPVIQPAERAAAKMRARGRAISGAQQGNIAHKIRPDGWRRVSFKLRSTEIRMMAPTIDSDH